MSTIMPLIEIKKENFGSYLSTTFFLIYSNQYAIPTLKNFRPT